MRIENNIVIYDKFKNIEKHKHWSMAKYTTIYGVQKIAIVLNTPNVILNNINNSYQIKMKLQKYNELFSNEQLDDVFKSITTLQLLGDYQINEKEYIINYPYNLNFGSNKISIIPLTIVPVAFKEINTEERMRIYYHKQFNNNGKTLIIYEMDIYSNIITNLHKGKKTKMNKQPLYFKETYEEIIKSYNNYRLRKKRIEEPVIDKRVEEFNINEFNEKLLIEVKSNDYIDNQNTLLINESNDKQIQIELPKIILNEEETQNHFVNDIINRKVLSIQDNSIFSKGSLEPEKKLRSFIATSRNLSVVKYLKNLYEDKCQICGEAIEISHDSFLSEVHHIKPLGVHNGPDVVENAIVLCPNHHSMFDRGAITIDIDKKIVIHFNPDNPLNYRQIELKHDIDRTYIAFHNQNIFINSVEHQNQKEIILAKNEIATTIQTIDFGNIVTLQDEDSGELFDIKLEDKFNKDFMKPIEKVLLRKFLNDTISYDDFQYKIVGILSDPKQINV